jgi:rod shape-determining protein MreD
VRKIRRLNIYSALAAAVFIHLALLNHIKVLGSKPDLVLTAVIFCGIFSGGRMGMEAGLIGGLALDIFSADIFGTNAFVFSFIGLISGSLSSQLFRDSKVIQFFLVLVFTMTSMMLHFVVVSMAAKNPGINIIEYLVKTVLLTGVYTAFVSIPVFSLMVKLFKLKEDAEYL